MFNVLGVEATPDSTATQRAASPAASGIPTPSGRSLVPRSQSATPDKQQNKIPQSSTPVPTSQNKISNQRSKLADNKQNSMLDKFKLFNSKDKAKTKSGAVTKGGSKGGSTGSASTSTLSTSSRSDSSYSSSFDAGASSSATSTNDLDSPVSSKPRPIVGGVMSSNRRDHIGSLTIGQQHSRQSSPSPSPAPVYSSSLPATPVSSLPTSNPRKSNLKHRGDAQGRSGLDQSRLPQSGSQTFTKGTKVGSLIPKSGAKNQKSSSTTSLASNQGTSNSPGLSSSIPMSNSSKGIPKPSSGKSLKSKEEKMRGLNSKESSKEMSSQVGTPSHGQSKATTGTHIQTSTLPKKSGRSSGNSSCQLVSPQSQTASVPQSSHGTSVTQAPPVPPHRNGSQISDKVNGNSLPRHHSNQAQTPTQGSKLPVDLTGTPKTRYTEIEYNDGKIERIGDGHFSKPTNQAVATSQSISNSSPSKSHKDYSHSYLITSQSVNVVKPTCSTPSPSVKPDGSSQTALSVLHTRSAQPPPLPKTEPPPSTRTNISTTNSVQPSQNGKPTSPTQKEGPALNKQDSKESKQDSGPDANHSTSSSASSTESIILNTSAANSPRLGVKVLGTQMNRQASNVAIVQPHHGEKKETTFDTEVHTDIINKEEKLKNDNNAKETSSVSDKNTKFVADSGETLDIQPMQPINRSLHYGGYMRGYATPNKQMPLPVSQGQCYAMTSVGGNRIGMNRSLMEIGKIYSSPIKRAISSGSGNVSFNDDASDYENYDYISGYMSDGDILKKNQMEDMNSGYMSEGGASLYARRLQQRFREGMQAVKECMQKSSGVTDDDRYVYH